MLMERGSRSYRKAPVLPGKALTYFISSGSSLSSLVGVTLVPVFLARGQPDKLVSKEEKYNRGLKAAAPPPPPRSAALEDPQQDVPPKSSALVQRQPSLAANNIDVLLGPLHLHLRKRPRPAGTPGAQAHLRCEA